MFEDLAPALLAPLLRRLASTAPALLVEPGGAAPETAPVRALAVSDMDADLIDTLTNALFAKGPGQDPTLPHIALAVADIVESRKELERMDVTYWAIEGLTSPDSLQLFLNDPCGNMVELHQVDKCRCTARNRL